MKLYMKKSLAIVLSLVLTISLLPIGAVAAAKPEIAIGSATAGISDGAASISIPVTISNNPGFAGMDLSFSLPEGWVLENISIREKDDYSVFYAEDEWGDMSALTKPMVNPAKGRFVAAYSHDISASGYLCWLSITVPANTAVGEYKIEVSANKINTANDTAADQSGSYSLVGGSVTVIESGVTLSENAVVADGIKTVTATAIDSQGIDVSASALWTVSPADKGVSVNKGLVTIGEGAEAGDYVIAAEGVGEAKLTVYTLRVEINGDAAEVSDFVYGVDWEDLSAGIDVLEDNIKVLTDTELEGRLYVQLEVGSSSKPDAGSHSYQIFFENEDYGPISVYVGEIVVAPAPLALPEAEEGLVYTGLEQTGIPGGEGYTVIGGSATEAGEYTATLSPDENHCWSDGSREAREISWAIARKTVNTVWTLTQRVYNGAEQYPIAEAEGLSLSISGGRDAGVYVSIASTDDKNHIIINNNCEFTILPSGEFEDKTAKNQSAVVGEVSFAQPVFSGFGGETVEGELSYSLDGEKMGYEAVCTRLSLHEKGTVTIDYAFTASGNYEGSRAGSISLEIVDIAFNMGNEPATAENSLEIKAQPTYGDSWEDILSVKDGLAAQVGDKVLKGQLSFNVSGIPEVGEHKVQLIFNGEGYEDVVVCETAIKVSPAKAEVKWSGDSFTYNGETQAPTAEALGINGESLSLEVEGAAADAGSYTAKALCKDKNYVLTNAEKDFTIERAIYVGKVQYTPVEEEGKTLAEAELKPDPTWGGGTLVWQDAEGNALPDSTIIEAGEEYFWSFTPENSNYEPLSGSIVLYVIGHALYIEDTENGTAELSAEMAMSGQTVHVTAKADKGYEPAEIIIADSFGAAIEAEATDEGCSFIMPDSEVYVTVIFKKMGLPFADVAESDWFYDPVHYAYYNGLMSGVSSTEFAPNVNLTRAMMMTILARMAGADTSGGDPWYEKGMIWAMENGVSDGTNPDMNITREQVVTMLYRYLGEPQVESDGLALFKDGDTASDWARNAMNWAILVGLMKGDDKGNVNPLNNATRAEISTIFQRLIENVMS